MRRDEVLAHNDKQLTYSVVELRHPSVFIIAVNSAGMLLVQRAYRYTLNQHIWEFPAGHSDGEDPLAAAQRELREEAGLVSADWVALGRLYQAAGIGNIPAEYFLARNVSSVTSNIQDDEWITDHRFVSLAALTKLVESGDFVQSADLAAVYLAQAKGLIDKE